MSGENELSFLQETADGGFVVDMTAVPEAKNEVLPKGTYDVVVSEAEYKLSQASGRPMWALQLTIQGGEYDGRKLFTNISFSDKALPYTKRTLAKIAPHILTADFRPDRIDDYGIAGMNLRAKTKIGKNEQNEPRTEVGDLLPAGDSSSFMGG